MAYTQRRRRTRKTRRVTANGGKRNRWKLWSSSKRSKFYENRNPLAKYKTRTITTQSDGVDYIYKK